MTPGGREVVIDGGPDPLKFAQFVGENMPSNDRTIEIVRYNSQTISRSCLGQRSCHYTPNWTLLDNALHLTLFL